VRVPDRRAMIRGEAQRAIRQPQFGDPQPGPASRVFDSGGIVGRNQSRTTTGRQPDYLVGFGVEQRSGSLWGFATELDDPWLSISEQTRRQMEHHVADGAVVCFASRLERGIDG